MNEENTEENTEEENVVPITQEDAVPKELTPEEIAEKQEAAKKRMEESVIAHKTALALNPLLIRDTFQKEIIDGLIQDPQKVGALCETYAHWSMLEQSAKKIDTSAVAEQVKDSAARYRDAVEYNSLVGRALFQKTIQEAVTRGGVMAGKLCKYYQQWNNAEETIETPTAHPTKDCCKG